MRERLKEKILVGTKGGRSGQWSARKAQLLAHEYESNGGGYKNNKNSTQKSLEKWGKENWHTINGKNAIEGNKTHRYLPDAAWKKLSTEQKRSTEKKKIIGSKKGKQFVKNTRLAAKARKDSSLTK